MAGTAVSCLLYEMQQLSHSDLPTSHNYKCIECVDKLPSIQYAHHSISHLQ